MGPTCLLAFLTFKAIASSYTDGCLSNDCFPQDDEEVMLQLSAARRTTHNGLEAPSLYDCVPPTPCTTTCEPPPTPCTTPCPPTPCTTTCEPPPTPCTTPCETPSPPPSPSPSPSPCIPSP